MEYREDHTCARLLSCFGSDRQLRPKSEVYRLFASTEAGNALEKNKNKDERITEIERING